VAATITHKIGLWGWELMKLLLMPLILNLKILKLSYRTHIKRFFKTNAMTLGLPIKRLKKALAKPVFRPLIIFSVKDRKIDRS